MTTTNAPVGSVKFGALTEAQQADYALDAGYAFFASLVGMGLTNANMLHVRIGIRDVEMAAPFYRQISERWYGDEDAGVQANLDFNTVHKAATCGAYGMDSDVVVTVLGHLLPAADGPHRWTGGVCYQVDYTDGNGDVQSIEIIVAASGVQGVFDRAVSYAVAATFAACWALKLKELATA